MFVISTNYTYPLEKVDKHLDAHVAYLKNEYSNGHFIASGRKIPRTGGVILSGVKSKNKFEVILAIDPFKQAWVTEYKITEFTPSTVAVGFENLKEQ